ncbi:vitamin K epoxide reductase family protein [Rothia terrae]|uniref:vitamin K epoxide reductase family protein n=1 Tax=Rothia terrae TaxID=396015 RepID=UPI002880D7F2|nr:vitamin K epoxide reductase family protein [Rothia terrae]MDT0188904.1 vitamin K epoxide reductase family protein [Rothia terrae]
MSVASTEEDGYIDSEESIDVLTERTDRRLGPLMFITGSIALAASSMLIYEKLQILMDANHQSVCDLNALLNCGTVMRHWQASVFGFPNPYIGLIGFTIIVTIGAALMAGARFKNWFWWGAQIGVTFAFCFILWLWSQTTFVINALCLFCMIVWIMTIPLFVKVTARNIVAGVIPAPAVLRRSVSSWSWFTVIMIYLLIFGIIFIRFFDQIMFLL